MDLVLVTITVAALGLAVGLAIVGWKLLRHDQAESDARVEHLRALAAMPAEAETDVIPALATPAPAPGPVLARLATFGGADIAARDEPDVDWDATLGRGLPLETGDMQIFGAPAIAPAPNRRFALVGAVAVVMLGTAGTVYAVYRPQGGPSPHVTTSAQPATRTATPDGALPLDLLSLKETTDTDGTFVVTGLVGNPSGGHPAERVMAVVYLFDREGHYFATGRAELDQTSLAPGDESPFVVKIAHGSRRGQVSCRLPPARRRRRRSRRQARPGARRHDRSGQRVSQGRRPLKNLMRLMRLTRTVDVPRSVRAGLTACVIAAALTAVTAQSPQGGQGFSFHTSVDLINVAATVTDADGNFVQGLKQGDFVVYEDGKPQPVAQFEAERVPVSLGIALDTSGSMFGERIAAAQAALNRFLFDLLGPSDEVFLYRFDSKPELVQRWTSDRAAVSRALGSVHPNGGTAMYDAVAEAIPLAQAGSRKKKALVIISDGNDTSSHLGIDPLHQIIRESEVLVYAIGIDASGSSTYPARSSGSSTSPPSSTSGTRAVPQPFPGKGPTSVAAPPSAPPPSKPTKSSGSSHHSGEGANVEALRALTDDSGGRTEIVVSNRDIDPATARIADELSQQVLHRLHVGGAERRQVAHDRGRGSQGELHRSRSEGLHRQLRSFARGRRLKVTAA